MVRMAGHSRIAGTVLLSLTVMMPAVAQAQMTGSAAAASSGPVVSHPATTRYTVPPDSSSTPPSHRQYQRYRQTYQDVQRDSTAIQSRTSNDGIDRAIQRQRLQLEADRQTLEAQRALMRNPVESERLRQDFEQEQRAFERWQRDMEQGRPKGTPPRESD
jgi:hypothetical protein